MKKSVLIIFSVILILSIFPLIFADLINSTQITKGFSCLDNQTADCSSLSVQEQIFTSLSSGLCTPWIDNSSNDGGFPSDFPNIVTTSQAILALKNGGLSTDATTNESVAWLLLKEHNTPNMNWYLEINSNAVTACTVAYQGTSASYAFTINQDKTINPGNAQGTVGNGLHLSSNKYWLLISPSYYGSQFLVSCNQSFTMTNLYQEQGSNPTIYVSSNSPSAPAGSNLNDYVNSSCFGNSGSSCDYASTLWATLALSAMNYSISPYLPYLTIMAGDDLSSTQQYLPYAFLYALTSSNDYLNQLAQEQVTVNGQSYWSSSGDPYYDTALALFTTASQSSSWRNDAISWLMNVQESDGCWNSDNILDTAFVLYALAGTVQQPSSYVINTTTTTTAANCSSQGGQVCNAGQSCSNSFFATASDTALCCVGTCINSTTCTYEGDYCISETACNEAGGTNLGYSCNSGISICCSKQLATASCSDQGGQICSSTQSCTDGSITSASDSSSCCLGTCANQQVTANDCQSSSNGICRSVSTSCLSGEQVSSSSCGTSSQVCCVPITTTTPASNSTLWIWILAILIVLLALVLLFRKKLKIWWIKMKSGKNKGNGNQQSQFPPRGPPFFPSPSPVAFQRRPQPIPPQRPRPQSSSETNDVLKKLKDMSK